MPNHPGGERELPRGGILVTGGSGYLGAVLVPLLRAHGHQVVVLDPAAPRGLQDPGIRHQAGSVADPGTRARALDGVTGVVHLAAVSSDQACAADPAGAVALNVDATAALAEEVAHRGLPRFVLASTCAVYGAAGDRRVDEQAAVEPGSMYARTKVAAELAVRRTLPGTATVLRFGTLYGPSPAEAPGLPVHRMVRDAIRDGVIRVQGSGDQWRAMVHVADAAQAILAALQAPLGTATVAGAVLNVADPDAERRIMELATMVAGATGARVVRTPAAPDVRSYRVHADALQKELGWSPRHTLPETILALVLAEQHRHRALAAALDRPAILGGRPVRSETLPLGLPQLGAEEEEEVIATLRSGWLTCGPRTRRFEDDLATWTGAPHAVAVSSCTAALHLSLAALGVGPGDEVIVPAVTWPSTANVVVHLGARPVLVDVDPTTLCLDPLRLPAAVSPRTKVIIPVHVAGQPAPMDEVWDFAESHGLSVVEDAAHALGAAYRGLPLGATERSATTCLSFYATKNMTTGEGGAVLTTDPNLATRIRLLANNGVTRDAWGRHGSGSGLHWEAVLPGYKAAMSDLQAAIGIHQLRRLRGFLQRRTVIADRYRVAFRDLSAVEPLSRVADVQHAWHLFVVSLRLEELTVDRDAFAAALRAEGIATGIHFRGLNVQPWFREALHIRDGQFPAAEQATQRILSLPLYPAMSDGDVEDVVTAVTKLAGHYARSETPLPTEVR